ncbi:MAG: dialkylresorcinol condensing enzyme [Neisseria sp.]|nr:dialkylresorcinol condensing enzyme [Neisseria sp.]
MPEHSDTLPTKNILVVSYSQTGQLQQMVEHLTRPLQQDHTLTVETCALRPHPPFAFPWRFMRFFDTFPETVHLQAMPLGELDLKRERYDLIIIAYTVWFLSPSRPISSFFSQPQARAVLENTPVITLIGCRNMWLMAQEKMKKLLADARANLIGNIVKTDECGSAASFIATPLWMLTGKKKAASWLPEAGVSRADITDCERFGVKIRDALQENQALNERLLQNMGAVYVNEKLILSETVAHRSFYLWGKLLMAAGRVAPWLRRAMLWFYIAFLITMILTVLPVSVVLKTLFSPLLKNTIRRQKAYFAQPSGE